MNTLLVIFGGVLTFAAIGSATAKLLKVPDVMAMMASVGVKPQQVPFLALLEIAGGVGVILGIWAPQLGIAATVGLVLYFFGAVTSHLRAKSKIADAGASIGILIFSLITLYLQLQR